MSEKEERFQIYLGSQSLHCCFEATVWDTTKPNIVGGEHWRNEDGQLEYEEICECFNIEDAELICKALNELHKQGKV